MGHSSMLYDFIQKKEATRHASFFRFPVLGTFLILCGGLIRAVFLFMDDDCSTGNDNRYGGILAFLGFRTGTISIGETHYTKRRKY